MSLLGTTRTAIGIDIGSRTIKAVQLQAVEAGYEITALTMVPRINPTAVNTEEIQNLRRVLRRQGFAGHTIVLAIPDEQLLRGNFDLPPGLSGAPVGQMARMELSRIHQVDPNSFEMIHWGLPAGAPADSRAQTVAVACPHDAADQLLNTVEAGGLKVQALDVRTAAAARACQCLTLAPPAITAILDLGWGSTKLLFVSGATVVYERLLKSELGSLTQTLCKRFHLPTQAACQIINAVGLSQGTHDADLNQVSLAAIHRLLQGHFRALTDELAVPFSYAARQYAQEHIHRLLLVGGGAWIPGLAHDLAQQLDMEVLRVSPNDVMTSMENLLGKADNPATTVALGLALFSEK